MATQNDIAKENDKILTLIKSGMSKENIEKRMGFTFTPKITFTNDCTEQDCDTVLDTVIFFKDIFHVSKRLKSFECGHYLHTLKIIKKITKTSKPL